MLHCYVYKIVMLYQTQSSSGLDWPHMLQWRPSYAIQKLF